MFFHYLGTELKHRIVPTDGTSFPASPISDPSTITPVPTHGFKLDTPGTYGYLDAYDDGINGQIVVQ
jgi:hypothetical protein